MKIRTFVLTIATALFASAAFAQGKLNVMTTTEDLASIAREVGGDRVTVDSMARGYQAFSARRRAHGSTNVTSVRLVRRRRTTTRE